VEQAKAAANTNIARAFFIKPRSDLGIGHARPESAQDQCAGVEAEVLSSGAR
jgi:hypothetical protein